VRIALSLPEKFHRYTFLDNKASHAEAVRGLVKREFPVLENRCHIEQAEANAWLQQWCRAENWRKCRAVVFLDPYGMAVEWATLEAIARTKAIDLWVLFPLGIGASHPKAPGPRGFPRFSGPAIGTIASTGVQGRPACSKRRLRILGQRSLEYVTFSNFFLSDSDPFLRG